MTLREFLMKITENKCVNLDTELCIGLQYFNENSEACITYVNVDDVEFGDNIYIHANHVCYDEKNDEVYEC